MDLIFIMVITFISIPSFEYMVGTKPDVASVILGMTIISLGNIWSIIHKK